MCFLFCFRHVLRGSCLPLSHSLLVSPAVQPDLLGRPERRRLDLHLNRLREQFRFNGDLLLGPVLHLAALQAVRNFRQFGLAGRLLSLLPLRRSHPLHWRGSPIQWHSKKSQHWRRSVHPLILAENFLTVSFFYFNWSI